MVEGASPHQLIQMLYDGALSNLSIARQHLKTNNREKMHQHIDKTIAIIQELQASLKDPESNELSQNLFELYTYLVSTLISSEKNMDDEGFGVCAHLLDVLCDAWQAIAPASADAA
jgi:flagellar protein FliS